MEKKPGFVFQEKKNSVDDQQTTLSCFGSLREHRFMLGMRVGKGPITSSALNKMMMKFDATGFFGLTSKKWMSLSSCCCCHDNGADVAIHVGDFCTWLVQCSRSFEEIGV